MRELATVAQAALRCGRCGRPPGKPCETNSGATATRLHAARTRPLEEAWRIGFGEGGRLVVDTIERMCDPAKADLDPRATLDRALTLTRRWLP